MRHFAGILLLLPLSAAAQLGYPVYLIPESLLENAQSVVRNAEVRYTVQPDGSAAYEAIFVYTILDKTAEHFAVAIETENAFENLKQLEGKVYDASGMLLRESKKQDIAEYGSYRDYEFTDSRQKSLDLRSAKYPYTVAFSIRKTISGIFRFDPFILERLGQSVEKASLTISAPADYRFHWNGVGTDIRPEIDETPDGRRWHWSTAKLAALPDELYTPYFAGIRAYISIAPEMVRINEHQGICGNWQQSGAFFYTLNADRDRLSAAMNDKVNAMTAGAPDTLSQIDTLYRYLQQHHRYVSLQIGIGGWQTLDAAFVEEHLYGDCKALSNYMGALLKARGIRYYHALVFGDTDGAPALSDSTLYPWFNHMILYLPDHDTWLECTSRDQPCGYLGSFTANRQALLLTPEGGKLVHTPKITPENNTRRSKTALVLDENGGGLFQNRVVTAGKLHEPYRDICMQVKKDQQSREYLSELGISVRELRKFNISASPTSPEAQVYLEADLLNVAARSGTRMFVPMFKSEPFKNPLKANNERRCPLYLPDGQTLLDTIIISLPPGYALENAPTGQSIGNAYGTYELEVQNLESGAIQIVRKLVLYPVHTEPEKYQEVYQFYQAAAKADGGKIVLVRKP